ncbi:sterile alpha motif domain-containing protein 12-like [Hypomesus transpacificus]|uniref:sterile alpha motif domain-containing protein 12-like n=1 Tax=Hypomesus transpacificus TaxID=137520 RepID=UPI001F072048|nr:sterile alpha motif domain-containing protein 12-like [Hypomesus transpacificus]
MGRCKRVSLWLVEDVSVWAQERYPSQLSTLRPAILKHAISGRALLRLRQHHLEKLGVDPGEHRSVLEDILLLRVQEELENLNDIYSECFSS